MNRNAMVPGAFVRHHHHEKWDGTGYPDRLKEQMIPLGARSSLVLAERAGAPGD